MNKRVNYKLIIEEIKRSDELIIDQKKAKKILKDELPKSCFNYSYLKGRNNDLSRFLMDNSDKYEFKIIPAQIIIRKK